MRLYHGQEIPKKENLFIMTYGNLQTKGLRFHWVSMEKNII